MFYTGVKFGLSHHGKDTDQGCLSTGYWGQYLDLRRSNRRLEESA